MVAISLFVSTPQSCFSWSSLFHGLLVNAGKDMHSEQVSACLKFGNEGEMRGNLRTLQCKLQSSDQNVHMKTLPKSKFLFIHISISFVNLSDHVNLLLWFCTNLQLLVCYL